MTDYSREEILESYDRYVEARDAAEAGTGGWDALADFFTEDAVFIDPAWGRVKGIAEITRFLSESMAGLEGWTFPREWTLAEGDRLVSGWQNRLPGAREDGSHYEARGISIMTYAGNGKFCYEEDLLNMVHVGELVVESGWTPGPGFNLPPPAPTR